MGYVFRSRTLSVSIERQPQEVYRFISDPQNLPKWATSFCQSVKKSRDEWIVETPLGVCRTFTWHELLSWTKRV